MIRARLPWWQVQLISDDAREFTTQGRPRALSSTACRCHRGQPSEDFLSPCRNLSALTYVTPLPVRALARRPHAVPPEGTRGDPATRLRRKLATALCRASTV